MFLRSYVLGFLCLACSALAQQYISAGPVPERPAAFAGATLAQPARPTIRRPAARTIQASPDYNSRTQSAETPPVRHRRPQPVARARSNLIEEDFAPQSFTKPRVPEYDDNFARPRVSSPIILPTQPPQQLTTRYITPKPVDEDEYTEEDEESGEDGTTPASISRSSYVGPFTPNQSPTPFQRPAFLQPTAFRPASPVAIQTQSNSLSSPSPPVVRQFSRPQTPQQFRPSLQLPNPIARPPAPTSQQSSSSEEDEDDEPQYIRQPVRQQPKRPAPQVQQEPETFRPTQPPRAAQPQRPQPVRQQEVYRPHPSKASAPAKERKPVVQTIRKYQDENEDGSITWGYENDDGTFKEETIGVDCVTRGKYGYYDPDGVKREYTYQTGIPCDREAEAEQAASANEGYIDYSNNKYVLPNGDEIDLEAMVKNRARKPVGKYRN